MQFKKMTIALEWIRQLLGMQQEVFYINGAQVLPPPLSREEEATLTEKLPDDEEAKRILIEHNLRLVVYIARKFESTNIGIEDLISIGTIGLMKAVNTFKADNQIKLATYASRCIENEILMYIRKNASRGCEMSLDEPLNVDWDGNELLLSDLLGTDSDFVYRMLEESEEKRTVRRAIHKLPERERRIIELRFGLAEGSDGKEKTQKEVADELGISQSYISRLEKRIITHLKEDLST